MIQAFTALLAQPDLPCLPARAHRLTQPGAPDRGRRYLEVIVRGFLARQAVDAMPYEPPAPAKRLKKVRVRRKQNVVPLKKEIAYRSGRSGPEKLRQGDGTSRADRTSKIQTTGASARFGDECARDPRAALGALLRVLTLFERQS